MNATFEWGDDVIDSRDIITLQEEMSDELDTLKEVLETREDDYLCYKTDGGDDPTIIEDMIEAINDAKSDLDNFEMDDFNTLNELVSEGESSHDWSYGETLIHESYFEDYIKDMINECWEMPKEIDSGKWPWRHMEMNWANAAEEAKNSDYFEINVGGETYYIRA